jgi:hypothetical protein
VFLAVVSTPYTDNVPILDVHIYSVFLVPSTGKMDCESHLGGVHKDADVDGWATQQEFSHLSRRTHLRERYLENLFVILAGCRGIINSSLIILEQRCLYIGTNEVPMAHYGTE